MAGKNTIDLNIVTELKDKTKEMGKNIANSSMTQKQKDVNTAQLSEVVNILNKGLNLNAKDIARVSSIFKQVTDSLVKASAGTTGFIKGLEELQKRLETSVSARDTARETKRNLAKRSLVLNDAGDVTGIRNSEITRLLQDNPVANTKGGVYKSADAIKAAAEKGVPQAVEFFDTIVKQTFERLKSEYSSANAIDIAETKNISDITSQISAAGTDPNSRLAVQMQEFGNELQNLINKIKVAESEDPRGPKPDAGVSAGELEKLGYKTEKAGNTIGKAFKQFSLYAIALRSIKKAAREAVQTITQLDKSLTEQAMVTGKTRQETYALLSSYQQLAVQLGTTSKEVAEIATQYMRQGKTTSEALTLTEAAISAAKVAGISAADSINYLTTALNGFQMSANDAMAVSDKFAAVASSSATSYDEIATALSKVASQANLAGMSIDYTTALLAKGLETTREAPETMGTALKTVIARMREIKDYGTTLAGDADVNNVESQLAYVGIALKNTNGELRSTEEVLDELGRKWNTLNSNQQAAIAKALAGTRQQSRLIAMMTDYERVLELQQISQRSAGATLAQMSKYMEGFAAATNRVQVAWEKVVTSLINNNVLISLTNGIGDILNGIDKIVSSGAGLVSLITAITLAVGLHTLAQIANNVELAKNNSLKGAGIAVTIASIIAKKGEAVTIKSVTKALWEQVRAQVAVMFSNPFGILAVGAVALIAAITAVAIHIASLETAVETAGKDINNLSADIYNLEKTSSSIDTIVKKFEKLDGQFIKTKEDLEELNSLLDSAGDSLSSNYKDNVIQGLGKVSEQEYYKQLSTNVAKMEFIQKAQQAYSTKAAQDRKQQLDIMKSLSEGERKQLFETDINARDALYAINNKALYNYIDAIKEEISLTDAEAASVEKLTQSILENVDAQEAYNLANNPERIKTITKEISKLSTVIDGNRVLLVDMLSSNDYSLNQQLDAFNKIKDSLGENYELINAFGELYNHFNIFGQMSSQVRDFIDNLNLSADKLNKLYDAYTTLQAKGIEISKDQWQSRYQNLLEVLAATGGDVTQSLKTVFGDIINDNEETWNAFVEAYGNTISQGLQNIGQSMDTIQNKINNFYEKATKWNELSQSERSEFIGDNSDIFSGADGDKLLKAFETGNYNEIEKALSGNKTLQRNIESQLKQVTQELMIEEAKIGEMRNETNIRYLQGLKKMLEDENNIYKASLKLRLEQENNALNEYKSFLQDQQDALTDSLEKRKNAYQKYFDAINKEEEALEYEQQANVLINNIAKLGSSTNADAMSASREMELKLADLEKERLKTLREQAQEAIIQNMEDTLDEINNKFDDLINSNRALLAAMTGDTKDPDSFLSNLIANQAITKGLTANGMQDYIQSLQATFGAILDTSALDSIRIEENEQHNLVLNVNGQEIALSNTNQQSVYEAVMNALRQVGVR